MQLSLIPETVAIVGSREFSDLGMVRAYVASLPAGTLVVTGGARGVDRAAEDAARVRDDLPEPLVFPALWTRPDGSHDPSAGFRRNRRIVAASDRLVAFWDGLSPGTRNSLDWCDRLGRPYRIFRPGDVCP